MAQTEKESDVGTTTLDIKQNDVVIVLRPDEDDGFEIAQTIITPVTQDKIKLFELSMVGIMMISLLEFLSDKEEIVEEYQKFIFDNCGENIMAVKEQLDIGDEDLQQFGSSSSNIKYH